MKYLIPILLSLSAASADTVFVNLDTSPLPGGTFSLVLYLIDGDATANNIAAASNVQFGGGSLFGLPTYVGGASGSIASTATVSDSSFFNAYFHDFTPGASLSFQLTFTRNFAGGTPDSLAFVLIDNSTGLPIPTLDPVGTDVFLVFDLSTPGLGQAYATDPERTSILLAAPVVSADAGGVPEPGSFVLSATALGGVVLLSWQRRKRLR